MDRVVKKYLANYAEPEVAALPALGNYQHCLVIPAFHESYQDVIRVWRNLPAHTLVILVLNSPSPNDSVTHSLAKDVMAHFSEYKRSENISLLRANGQNDVLLIDRFRDNRLVPTKQGVGLARKIGADIALALIAKGNIAVPRISVTDADVSLPATYFAPAMGPQDAALIYPFVHVAPPELVQASELYEISMLYYAVGLQWAGSPYGFTTIGSLIAISPTHYAKVRGFPKRNAGEDFYLLNKLAKTGEIRSIAEPTIQITARLSQRVPFGTGPALRKIMNEPIEAYLFYNPAIFYELSNFLSSFAQLWTTSDIEALYDSAPHIRQYCSAQKFFPIVEKSKSKIKSEAVFMKFLHDWFDAFRTLKFVHEMRRHFPSVPLADIHGAPFIDSPASPRLLRNQLASRCHS